jgi:hypothetical protein
MSTGDWEGSQELGSVAGRKAPLATGKDRKRALFVAAGKAFHISRQQAPRDEDRTVGKPKMGQLRKHPTNFPFATDYELCQFVEEARQRTAIKNGPSSLFNPPGC